VRLADVLPGTPPLEALIGCEVDVGSPSRPAWEPRTYHAVAERDGSYRVNLGGPNEPRERFPSWLRVVRWLAGMRPRALEVLATDPLPKDRYSDDDKALWDNSDDD